MNISYWCMIIACILPYLFIVIAKSQKGYLAFNDKPRIFLENLNGYRARAHWASKNSFEALPIFIGAILFAHIVGDIDLSTLNTLAVIYIGLRLVYGFLYIGNLATLRSLVWMTAFVINIAIFVIPLV